MERFKRFERSIYTACSETCSIYSDNIFIKHQGRRLSFGETYEKTISRAAFLQKQGISKDDIVGIIAENSPEWCISFLAITSIGATALPLDTNLSKNQHEDMLKAAGASCLFTGDGFHDRYKLPSFAIEQVDSPADIKTFSPPECSADDIAVLIFTSGTTGTPKIVSLTHRNLLHIAYVCTDLEEYTQGDQTLAILPLFHIYALESTFLAPFVTGSMIIMQTSLKGPDIMQSLADNDISIFPAAPIMWELFFDGITNKARAESEKKYKLFMFLVKNAPLLRKLGLGFLLKKVFTPVHDVFGHSHRFFISGGAPMKREYFNAYKNMGFNIFEGYGLSETTGPIAVPYYKDSEAGSVGRPMKGNEVKIININKDGIGEICLRGFAVSPGYYKNDEANKEAFDEDGFFRTGDLGRLDKKGNIRITGRIKNVIVLDSGKNVYPEEMEFYYRNSDKINEIAVFERKHKEKTTIHAVVVPAKKSKDSYREIREELEKLNRELPDYKRVKKFSISFDELPKNSSKKIMYNEIISLLEAGNYQAGEDDSVVLKDLLQGTTPKEEKIISLLKEKFNVEFLYENSTPADFNVDSLSLIDLIVFLEQNLNVVIDSKEFRKKETMTEILAYTASLEETDGASLDSKILTGEITSKANRFFNPLHHVVIGFFGFLSKIFWKLDVKNRDKLQLDNNILISNHQSYLDMVWIASSIPLKQRKQIYVTGKKRLSFLRYIFPILPIIYVDETNGIEVLKAGADILRQGKTLIIFPEGTRSRDGSLGEFMNGAAYLAKKLNRDVVPLSIDGSYRIWPRHKKLPSIITGEKGYLSVGEIIKPDDYENIESLNDALYRAVAAGLPITGADEKNRKEVVMK